MENKIFTTCQDVLIHRRDDSWLISNPRVHQHVELDSSALQAVGLHGKGASWADWVATLESCYGMDRTRSYFGEKGLVDDHTAISDVQLEKKKGKDLLDLLLKKFIIVEKDHVAYRKYLAPMNSILDREHLGTFHQNIGRFLTLKERIRNKWQWWHDQKFESDGRAVKKGPYQNIQEHFIDDYFKKNSIKGLRILDFGCGNGFYSEKLAASGASVVGLDTSKDLIDLAQKNYGSRATFVHAGAPDDVLHLGKFDRIFLQDTLLLLLNPEDPGQNQNVLELFRMLRSILTEGGRIHLTEPNPLFWLSCRFGGRDMPMTVITEYRDRIFNVVPLLEEVVSLMSSAGFGLVEYTHPQHRNTGLPEDEAMKNFANQFCVWDFMTFAPVR